MKKLLFIVLLLTVVGSAFGQITPLRKLFPNSTANTTNKQVYYGLSHLVAATYDYTSSYIPGDRVFYAQHDWQATDSVAACADTTLCTGNFPGEGSLFWECLTCITDGGGPGIDLSPYVRKDSMATQMGLNFEDTPLTGVFLREDAASPSGYFARVEIDTVAADARWGGGGGDSTYVLPTMSASVKGGAKLGKGLEMNGDTLNVKAVSTNFIYISPDGSDATGQRGNVGAPFFTISGAKAAYQAGDVISINPGTYTGQAQLGVSGEDLTYNISPKALITFSTYAVDISGGSTSVTIRGNGTLNGDVKVMSGATLDMEFDVINIPTLLQVHTSGFATFRGNLMALSGNWVMGAGSTAVTFYVREITSAVTYALSWSDYASIKFYDCHLTAGGSIPSYVFGGTATNFNSLEFHNCVLNIKTIGTITGVSNDNSFNGTMLFENTVVNATEDALTINKNGYGSVDVGSRFIFNNATLNAGSGFNSIKVIGTLDATHVPIFIRILEGGLLLNSDVEVTARSITNEVPGTYALRSDYSGSSPATSRFSGILTIDEPGTGGGGGGGGSNNADSLANHPGSYYEHPLTTKGDIFTFSTVKARLPVGTNGYALLANSSQTTGLIWSDLSTLYFPLSGGSITGTGGAGFIGLIPQSSAPSTPASGVRLYARSTGGLSWKGTNGFSRTIIPNGQTADRTYKLQNADMTLADSAAVAVALSLKAGLDFLPAPRATINNSATLYSFGDSFTVGGNATVTAKRYTSTIAEALTTAENNQGVSGTGYNSAAGKHYTAIVSINNVQPVTVMAGFNDIRRSVSTKTTEKIKGGLRAILANQFLHTATPASSGTISKGGTWTAVATATYNAKADLSLSGTAMSASVAGATLTYTSTGNSLVVGCFGADSLTFYDGRFTVSVDGTVLATFDPTNKSKFLSGTDPGRTPNAVVIFGLGGSTHTVVITTLDSRATLIDYIGTLNIANISAPILVGGVVKESAAGYAAAFTSYGTTVGDAEFDAVNAAIQTEVEVFRNAGYPALYINTNKYFNTTTDLDADNVHPNNLGHGHIAQAFLEVMQPSTIGQLVAKGISTTTQPIVRSISDAGVITQMASYPSAQAVTGFIAPGVSIITTTSTSAFTGMQSAGTYSFFNGGVALSAVTASFNSSKQWHFGSNATPTAYVDIEAAGAASASLRLRSGGNVTSPNEGDVWNVSNVLKMRLNTTTYRPAMVNDVTPANGQLPIGNGTAWTAANITAGTGVAVTNGSGTITLASDGKALSTLSSAGTLTLSTGGFYTFSGTTTTWTLPVIAGNTGVTYYIKNRGSSDITLNSNAGGNDLYSTSAVATITIAAGASAIVHNDSGAWVVE